MSPDASPPHGAPVPPPDATAQRSGHAATRHAVARDAASPPDAARPGTAPVAIRPAATVLVVRDSAAGELEVCLLRRNLESTFVGGVSVFPGGAVEPADGDPAVLALCDGRTDAEASARLGIDHGGLAYWVAAIRETFEEAGLLPATWAHSGAPLHFSDDAFAARFAEHRAAVDREERSLAQVLETEGLRLDLTAMHYVSHWITPPGRSRRYDTRFFLAQAPAGQQLLHDGREAIEGAWMRPVDAIARQEAGELVMRPPTVWSLHQLARSTTAAEALAEAAALQDVPSFGANDPRDTA
ncbi:MAG: hypothetical protein AAGC46_02870 [Solirubrobacteraceae bacterium]|nr:NUDIX domain-containing protein [Patulibacter sp.]